MWVQDAGKRKEVAFGDRVWCDFRKKQLTLNISNIPPISNHPPCSTMSLSIADPSNGRTLQLSEGFHTYEDTFGHRPHWSSTSDAKCQKNSRSLAQLSNPANSSASSFFVMAVRFARGLYSHWP